MKTQIISTFVLITTLSYGQIPNGSFEQWTNGRPVGWHTSDTALVQQGSPGFVGNSYVRVGNDNLHGYLDHFGFAYTARPYSFNGYIRYDIASVGITAMLTRWDSVNAQQEIIGVAGNPVFIGGQESNWTYFEASFSYLSNLNPDSCSIIIGSEGAASNGEFLDLDDLSFSMQVGTPEMDIPKNDVIVRRIDSELLLQFQEAGESPLHVDLYDSSGALVKRVRPSGYMCRVDLADLASGLLFARCFISDGSVLTKKILW